MTKLRVIYFGAGPVAVDLLRYLAAHHEVEIVAVAAWPRARQPWWGIPDVPKVAQELGLPTVEKEDGILTRPTDVLFSVYYDRIIGKDILAHPTRGAINLHAAPLPEYRGRFTFLHAILNGETEYGVTLHYMDEGVDTGDIIAQWRFPIDADITAKGLYDVTAEEGKRLFKDTLPDIIADRVQATPQGLSKHVYRTGDFPDGEVDLSWAPDQIDRFVRALYFPPFDPAFVRIGGKRYFLSPGSSGQ
jgi:methionyl-tRNA formyltransferase